MARDGFDDIAFPMEIALGARITAARKTDVVQTASGGEVRRRRWSRSRRSWDVAGAIRSLADAEAVLGFFDARAGRARSFAFFDPFDHSSAALGLDPAPTDQTLGMGDGAETRFLFSKVYGGEARPIELVRADSLRVAIDGTELDGSAFTLSQDRNAVILGAAPAIGAIVTAGFFFDTPARFDTDEMTFELGAKGASLPSIPLVEVIL